MKPRELPLRAIVLLQMSTNRKVVSLNQKIVPHQLQNLSPTTICIQHAMTMSRQAMIHTPSIKQHHLQGHRYEHHFTLNLQSPHILTRIQRLILRHWYVHHSVFNLHPCHHYNSMMMSLSKASAFGINWRTFISLLMHYVPHMAMRSLAPIDKGHSHQ